jgi:hypothetical protein
MFAVVSRGVWAIAGVPNAGTDVSPAIGAVATDDSQHDANDHRGCTRPLPRRSRRGAIAS